MFKGERVIVPKGMQAEMLQAIRNSHFGKKNASAEQDMSYTGQEWTLKSKV